VEGFFLKLFKMAEIKQMAPLVFFTFQYISCCFQSILTCDPILDGFFSKLSKSVYKHLTSFQDGGEIKYGCFSTNQFVCVRFRHINTIWNRLAVVFRRKLLKKLQYSGNFQDGDGKYSSCSI
jgi:hypothetical protein